MSESSDALKMTCWSGLPPVTPGLVSVVIVGHNNWPDLEMAIQSALHQSYRPVEVIVVDNGSSDATPIEVPKLFGSAVRYLRQVNRGAASGYNAGVQQSRGEFVQLLEGDDLLAPNKIEKQVEVFRSDADVDIVYGDGRAFHSHAGINQWQDCPSREYPDMVAALVDPKTEFVGLLTHTLLYRRRTLERVGPWDETQVQTILDHSLRSAWSGCRFRYCPRSLCFYRRRPGQMSEDSAAMRRSVEDFWVKALGYITSEPYRSGVLERLSRLRFYMGIFGDGLTTRQALGKLAQAHSGSPRSISWADVGFAGALVLLPGGRWLASSPGLRPVRSVLRRLLRFPVNC